MKIFVFGSSLVSSYWNGAATYYRGIYKALHLLGHSIVFAEPDAYGRQEKRDKGDYSYAHSIVYEAGTGIDHLLHMASDSDIVIKHSGIGVDDEELEVRVLECQPRSKVIFWDVDAPDTIAKLKASKSLAFARAIPSYDAILTYGGGPQIEQDYRHLGASKFASIYNGLDPSTHYPVAASHDLQCDLVFLGNRLPDREERVDELFLRAARLAPEQRFLLGGEGWSDKSLPPNVKWLGHVPSDKHNVVNCSARMVLNVNRSSMAKSGFSPPTRIFEVAGSGSCLLCDDWQGVEDCFEPRKEIIVVRTAEDIASVLRTYSQADAAAYGKALRERALRDHTYAVRAKKVDAILSQLISKASASRSSEYVA